MSRRNEQGMASIVIVGVLVVLLALISIGFSKIMNRAVTRSLNNQLSSAATYAAQSGINDAMAYIKGQPNPSDVSSNDCTSLLKEPGMSNLTDLSGDGNTKITCLMVNPTPTDLMYQQLSPNGSQVIKATTSDAVDKVMFSWQASNGTNTNSPSSLSFTDVTTWNNAGNVPVLRVGLYPVPPSGKITGIESKSKTFFLVPGQGGSNVTTIPYSTADGSVEQVACNAKNTGINGFTADYACNAIVDGLYANIAPNSYYYLTVTPIYNQADVKIKATNSQKQQVQFINVQTVIDSTAKANNATKRLQERVDSNTTGDNIAASDDAAPGYSIRSAKALCKQLEFHKSYYNYVLNDAPSTCQTGGSGIQTVPPTLKLTITGNDGLNNNVTRDSGDATPSGSGYYGAVYVDSRATVNWKSTDSALSCDASSNPNATDTNGYPWNEDKNPRSSWNGVTGTGSATFTGISRYTTYSMICKGPGGTTPTRTVTAWPRPIVDFSGSTTSYQSDQSYTIRWNSYNATKCTISSSGNEPWNQTYTGLNPRGDYRKQSFGGPQMWNDDSSKSYTVTCWDPVGRSTSQSFSVGRNSGNGRINPPSCDANTYIYNNGDGTASFGWTGTCPSVSPDSGYYCIYSTSDPAAGSVNTCGVYRNGGPYKTGIRSKVAGDWNGGSANQTFCLGIRGSAGVWGQQVDRNNCYTVPPPPINMPMSLVQGVSGQSNVYLWYPSPGSGECHDGSHYFVMCVSWKASQINGNIDICKANGYSSDGGNIPAGTYSNDGSGNWYNKTFGWPSWPGNAEVQVTCYSATFGNSSSETRSAYATPLPPPPPPPPPPSSGGGNSGGGSGGGGKSGGCGFCCALNNNQFFYPEFGFMELYFARVTCN